MVLKAIVALTLTVAVCRVQETEVRKILDDYESLKPSIKELAWYELDWAGNLKEAKERAAREKRPICALICLNVFGNLYTGHC